MESENNPAGSVKTYMCEACNLDFKHFHEWKQHLSTHPVTKYECNFCFSSYSNKTNFWDHIKTHTTSSTAIKYFCSKYTSEEREQFLQEKNQKAPSKKDTVEGNTDFEPLEKGNSVSNFDTMAEHSEISVEEELNMIVDDDSHDGDNLDDDVNSDENLEDEKPDDKNLDNESQPQSAEAAAKLCMCNFCDKSFPSPFLFKIHLKKHCLPLTYLQVKCLGEPMSLGILVGKSD